MKKFVAALTLVSLATPLVATAASASTAKSSCASVTKKLVVSDGFTQATGPKVTKYDYKHPKKNAANALGTTIDFGAKALIVGCVSPRDLVHLSKQAGKKTMSATAYMKYMVAQSGGAMTKTKVGPVFDYLDFGNGKEDGLGSLSKAGSIRLDAWVAGKYIFLGFSQPASSKPTPQLLKFITWTNSQFH